MVDLVEMLLILHFNSNPIRADYSCFCENTDDSTNFQKIILGISFFLFNSKIYKTYFVEYEKRENSINMLGHRQRSRIIKYGRYYLQ